MASVFSQMEIQFIFSSTLTHLLHALYIQYNPHSEPSKPRLIVETLRSSLVLDLEVGYHHTHRGHCALCRVYGLPRQYYTTGNQFVCC